MSQEITTEPALARVGFREQLAGFGLVGIGAFAIIMLVSLLLAPIGGLLIVLWAFLSRTPMGDVGLVKPKSWIADSAARRANCFGLSNRSVCSVSRLMRSVPNGAEFRAFSGLGFERAAN